jgi:glyoxylase-like metal-dependent hydrolase (beta-lactamase superfamily II)
MAAENPISLASHPRWWHRKLVRLLALAVVVALFATLAWWTGRRKDPPYQEPIFHELHPLAVALARDVYLLGESSPAAVYAVDTSAGLVLIDSGMDPDAALVLRQLARLHLDVKRLTAVLLTHAHADHSGGAAYLRKRTGAKVYAGRADSPILRNAGPREALVSTFHMPLYVPHATEVDVELDGNETLTFGESRFTVLGSPGHSPGSICYLLEHRGQRILFTGDVIQSLSASKNTSPLGTYTAHLPPVYRGSAGDYLTSLRRLRALSVPDLVLPGHPRLDRVPQDPALSQERWEKLLDAGIHELEQLLARYKADGANFLDGSARELLPGLRYLGNQGDAAVYCVATPMRLFVFDAPGGPALADLLLRSFAEWGKGRTLTALLLTSADAKATAGLSAVVKRTGCAVVSPKAAVERVRRLCPAGTRVLTEDELELSSWLDVHALPLEGRGVAPVAYQLRWGGKTVLVSGRIPVKLSDPSVEELEREVLGSAEGIPGYLRSLERLEAIKPDLWLPAVPVHGQNANLYDQDWAKVLELNRRVMR